MRRLTLWAGLLLVSVSVTGVLFSSSVGESEPPSGWKFSLPAGDAEAGEMVFIKMNCQACHKVSGRQFPEAETAGASGPELNAGRAGLPREYLAESIMNLERWKTHGTYGITLRVPGGESRMADYTQKMTLRELIDLVEFLKQVQ